MDLEERQTIFNRYIAELQQYVAEQTSNGITQRSEEWLRERVYRIGGSQIATIIGKNEYSKTSQLLREKLGFVEFQSNIYCQWGVIFEPVIKEYIEMDKSTDIVGSEIYVLGPPGTSYSPDGLGVIDEGIPRRVLFEFKCPYSRIPTGAVPTHYLPQVLYGLDILPCVDVGLFAEGIFRRCTWEEIGDNIQHDRKLNATQQNVDESDYSVLAFGFVGFYSDERVRRELAQKNAEEPTSNGNRKRAAFLNMDKLYIDELYEYGEDINDYMTNDLGDTSVELVRSVINANAYGILKTWYGKTQFVNGSYHVLDAINSIENSLSEFEEFCRDNDYRNYGILPWKLLKVVYNYVEKQPGFVEKHMPKITEIINMIKEYHDPKNKDIRHNLYTEYMRKLKGGGFE